MTKSSIKVTSAKLALCVAGILVGILACEITLRIIFPPVVRYFTWQPGLREIFIPVPELVPNISGTSLFFTNSYGIRGNEFSPLDSYRILVTGGSSAECLYLDQAETWPSLLGEKLKPNNSVWVGNIGKSSLASAHHILQMKFLLPELPRIDMIVLLMGVNDLSRRLAQDIDYDPSYFEKPQWQEKILFETFAVLPQAQTNAPWFFYRKSAIWRLLNKIVENASRREQRNKSTWVIEDAKGIKLLARRQERLNATYLRQSLPDLASALAGYEKNINAIIDLAKARSIRLLFVTQPVLWSRDLFDGLRKLLWFGYIDNSREFYAVEALEEGIYLYNQRLIEVCRKRGVECLDLANQLPKDTSVFYDDCHFNEPGARKVAGIIAQYLLQSPPFNNGKSQQTSP